MSAPLLEARDLTIRTGSRLLFDGFNFSIHEGEKICLTAPSGRGKTVLLRILAGIEKPDSGILLYRGLNFDQGGKERMYREFNWLPQRISLMAHNVENVLKLPFTLNANKEQMPARQDMLEALQKSALPDLALDQPADGLSGGERQRIAIARALLLTRPFWIADEPTAALDGPQSEKIGELLIKESNTLLASTHDDHLRAQFTRIVALPDLPPASPVPTPKPTLGKTQ